MLPNRPYGPTPYDEILELKEEIANLHDHDKMLAHLVDEWGTAGVMHKLLANVPPDQIHTVIAVAIRNRYV